jgi:hypothetical protein
LLVHIGIDTNNNPLPSLLTTSKTTNDPIGEAVGGLIEATATGEMGQAAELTINR